MRYSSSYKVNITKEEKSPSRKQKKKRIKFLDSWIRLRLFFR